MGGSTIHPSWDKSWWRMMYSSRFQLVDSIGRDNIQHGTRLGKAWVQNMRMLVETGGRR